jgi:hypothetical protein
MWTAILICAVLAGVVAERVTMWRDEARGEELRRELWRDEEELDVLAL